jgi:hypothetical protein
MFGRELLLSGIQWGIGDGRAVKIKSDHWIPDRPPYMLKPTKPIPDVATVSCLIDELTGTWIPESVYAFFDKKKLQI